MRHDCSNQVSLDAVAAIVCAVVIIWVCIWMSRKRHHRHGSDTFYTQYGVEEPTRSYVPYTGTVENGSWGVRPWAEIEPAPSGCSDEFIMSGFGATWRAD